MTFDKPQLDNKAVYRALADNATFATVLQIICLCQYGHDIYQWDILELLTRLEEDFNVHVTDENEQKLNAILMATSTEAFYQNPEAFKAICNTLTEGDPSIDFLDDLTLAEVIWGMWEVDLNHGPGDYLPAVQRIIDREVNEEANDPEDDAPGFGYIQNILSDRYQSLVSQLEALGVPTTDLPPPPALETPDGQEPLETPVSDPTLSTSLPMQ